MKIKIDKPLGESKLGSTFGTKWNNLHTGTTSAITCICGTEHPELPENADSLMISQFLGAEVVEDCCGAVFDRIYQESGEIFAVRFLEEFAENPGDPRFSVFRMELGDCLVKAAKKAKEINNEIEVINQDLKKIGE
jgi:hypothetical protein